MLQFASSTGIIGALIPLTTAKFDILKQVCRQYQCCTHIEALQVQFNISKVILGVGGFTNQQWRAFKSERRPLNKSSESRGFIDGDLIEALLDLPPAKQDEAAKAMQITTAALLRRVDELARIH